MPLPKSVRSAAVTLASFVLLLAACTSAPAATAPPSRAPEASMIPSSPSPVSDPSVAPTVAPSVDPQPTPNSTPPTPRSVTWADPTAVDALAGCFSIVPTVDRHGGIHVAATCPDGLRYATTRDGRRWTSDHFPVPDGRDDLDPIVAVSGDTVAFGWTRDAIEEGGCGDDGLVDLGAFVRTRNLADDVWSPARRIGAAGDHLQSMRSVGSTIHAVIDNEEAGKTWYERMDASSTSRVEVRGASGAVALRVANDGRPHLVYEAAGAIRHAVIRGGVVDSEAIPGTVDGIDPSFVLGVDDTAYILFSRNNLLGGCAEPEPSPSNGAYFASNAGGEWSTEKVSDLVGITTLTVDPETSEVHAIVGDLDRIAYVHRPSRGSWIDGAALPTKGIVSSVAIRQDPQSGELFVMYVQDASDPEGEPAFQVMLVREG